MSQIPSKLLARRRSDEITSNMNSPGNISLSEFSEYIGNYTNTKVSNCISVNSTYYYYYARAESIYFYGILFVVPFGLIGNIFSICVFLLSAILRCTTTGQYLVALAVADSTVLIGDAIRWLAILRYNTPEYYFPQYLGLNFYDTSSAACKTTNFLRYAGNLWSVWLTIAISVERLIAVALPLRIGHLSTPRRTKVMIACIGLVSCVLGSFAFWTMHSAISQPCDFVMLQCVLSDSKAYAAWNTAVVKLSTVLIPGILIVILTIAIIALLHRARKKRKAQLNVSQKKHRQGSARLEVSVETQLTIMLVAVCVSTIALRTPYSIAYYYRSSSWAARVGPVKDMQTYVAYRITNLINTVNYAINFILYCLCGSSFRREARKIFFKAHEKTNRCSSIPTEEISLNDVQRKSAGNISRA